VVIGGDVFPGPLPRETIQCLVDIDIPTQFLHGNVDREVLAQMSGFETDWYRTASEQWREPVRWTAQQQHTDRNALFLLGLRELPGPYGTLRMNQTNSLGASPRFLRIRCAPAPVDQRHDSGFLGRSRSV